MENVILMLIGFTPTPHAEFFFSVCLRPVFFSCNTRNASLETSELIQGFVAKGTQVF